MLDTVAGGLFGERRVDGVHEAAVDVAGCSAQDDRDRDGDQEADERVRERESGDDAERADPTETAVMACHDLDTMVGQDAPEAGLRSDAVSGLDRPDPRRVAEYVRTPDERQLLREREVVAPRAAADSLTLSTAEQEGVRGKCVGQRVVGHRTRACRSPADGSCERALRRDCFRVS